MSNGSDAASKTKIHLLDVGQDEYGDALLCQFGNRTVLIDGAHPGDDNGSPGHDSIPDQIGRLLNKNEPYVLDLLIITHAHQDHIGCIPKLVADERLRFEWALVADPRLGWGRGVGDDDSAVDARVLALTAALREEIKTRKSTDSTTIERFISDAANLETRYTNMIDKLATDGTRVVRHGVDSASNLLAEFANIGFKIVGPPDDHLLICAQIIHDRTTDSMTRASDFFTQDSTADLATAYRRLASPGIDSVTGEAQFLDAGSRPGPAINLQSIITQFALGGHKFLFAGDFQFAKPEVNNDELETSVRKLRKAIKLNAPYSFVKLSHHGSHNSFSEDILEDLKTTKYLGLCAGETSTHHPSRDVLRVLDDHSSELKWARTDRNGLVTFTFKQGTAEPVITLSHGELNDPRPNDTDIAGVAAPTPMLPAAAPQRPISPRAPGPAVAREHFVEVQARIPTGTRIKFSGEFTVDVESASGATRPPGPDGGVSDAPIRIGGGRSAMRDLLFVTSAEALKANIGSAETEQIFAAFAEQGVPLDHGLPAGLTDSNEVGAWVRDALSQYPNSRGVVILGAYDVVPAQILDCLPNSLRALLSSNEDPDNFIVWSDDIYGDSDGDGLPEMPVSRIPDAKSAGLISRALAAVPAPSNTERFGIRNIARPFANQVFQGLNGMGSLLVSKNTVFDQNPAYALAADKAYFMLHGDYVDGSRFWGEGTPANREAFNINNLPVEFRGVAFAGCCWGALAVDTPAGRVAPNRPFGQKTVESSIALTFLARGAIAFVGCTGAHYSPLEPPYDYFGGPMHIAFWRNYHAGLAPADALFRAKIEYIQRMPHGRTGPVQTAIEYKILRQYTCLGLGW